MQLIREVREEYDKDLLARNMQKYRINLSMSQTALAMTSGVSRATVADLEKAKRDSVTFGTIKALAEALETTPEALLCAKTV